MLADRDLTLYIQLDQASQLACAYMGLQGNDQLSPIDFEEARAIATVTIHVELVIGIV